LACLVLGLVALLGWKVAHPSHGPNTVAAARSQAGPAARAGRPDPSHFLTWDASRRTVNLTLLAGFGGANNGFNFDGYGRGELLITVPRDWRVTARCENRGAMRHSCAVVSNSLATTPAFPGASSPDPVVGLSPGAKATLSFVPTRTGSYRIACLVPGHEQARMFAVLVIAAGGRPEISARPGP